MNRKASSSTILTENIMYIILLVFFLILIMGFLYNRSNSAALWEDFYAKELARIVNSGQAGDMLRLDVQKGTVIAKRNGLDIQEVSNIFTFNAKDRKICVQLSRDGGSCYPYFSDLVVTEVSIELGVPDNYINFKLARPTEVKNE